MFNLTAFSVSSRMISPNRLRSGDAFRVLRALLVGSAFIVGAVFSVHRAYAQDAILDRTQVVKELDQQHGETTAALGLASNGGVLELFTSADGSTWTLILTMPDGKSRVVGEGEAWINVAAKPKGRQI